MKPGNSSDGNGGCAGRLWLLGGLLPSSPWELLCFSPMNHPLPPPKERREEEERQPGWMGAADVVGISGQGMKVHGVGISGQPVEPLYHLPVRLGLSIPCRWDFHPP